jgi:PIN domain nuclease of toxin-antitoxin system
MTLLLDTHVLLWWLDDHPNLSARARESIASGHNLIFISATVIWEIRIKQSLGKLEIPGNFRRILEKQSFEMLPFTVEHAHAVGDLPSYHRDPFDRMLIAQAKVERFTIITHDPIFTRYQVPIIHCQ